MQKGIDLTERQHGLILEQVQSVYGSSVRSLEFIVRNQESPRVNTSNIPFSVDGTPSRNLHEVWGRIRRGLITACGEATDRNWFSKLTANIDKERKEIKLKAPTSFVKDWIQQNYQHLLEQFCNKENYRLMELAV